MQKINLLYVITKLELGGAQKQLLSLIDKLDKNRFNIFLLTAHQGLLLKDASGINELTIRKSRCLERPINPLKDILALIEIYRFIKKNKIDIVHTHSSKAGILGRLAAKLAKVRIIIHTVHGWSFHNYQPALVHKLYIFLERTAANFTDKLIVVSNYDKQKGLQYNIGREGIYITINYGIDEAEFGINDPKTRNELGANTEDLLVGMVSCFKPQKSPQDFIRLACLVNRSLPNVKFILIGDGVLRRKTEKLIRRLKLEQKVILTGWRKDIPRILEALDVFVLTSLWEGLPIAALEAITAEKPIVVTNTGGITEVVEDGKTGFLVEPQDIERATDKLTMLLKDENLRREIAQNAKNSLGANFALEEMVNNSHKMYEDLIRAKI